MRIWFTQADDAEVSTLVSVFFTMATEQPRTELDLREERSSPQNVKISPKFIQIISLISS